MDKQNVELTYKLYLEILQKLISYKSISTDPKFMPEILKTVEFLTNLFKEYGFEVKVFEGYANPIIVAKYEVPNQINPKTRTVLIYGHYDVQPADIKDGWKSDPFVLTERAGKLYARGVVDNKGQVLIHIASIFALIKKNQLKKNVIFLLEGNEETGSAGIGKFLKQNSNFVQSDIIMISDGEIPYKPTVTASFRGTFNISVKLKTANNNLHSGLYGGPTPSASVEASRLVAKLINETYRITVPNFYEGAKHITEYEEQVAKNLDKERKPVLQKTGCKKFFNHIKNSFSLTVGRESMLTVTGLKTGYIGDGFSNIIPNTAEIKFNFRIAPGQNAKKILHDFKGYVKQILPDYVEHEFSDVNEIVDPVIVNLESSEMQETIKLLKEVYKQDVLVDFCGATLPIVLDFKRILKKDPLLVSFGNDDCNMHGVDENFDIGLIKLGIDFSTRYFSRD